MKGKLTLNQPWNLADFAAKVNGPPGKPGGRLLGTAHHQWSVAGGRGDPLRGSSFEGHLEQCLALGGFK